MSKCIRRVGPKAWLLCGLALWLIAVVGIRANTSPSVATARPTVERSAAPQNSPQPGQTPASPQGADVCANCHTDKAEVFKGTPHAASPLACVGCHGDAKAHIDAGGAAPIRNFKSKNASEISQVCESCHTKGNQKHFVGSMHDSRNVSCITCHEPHPAADAPVPTSLLRKPELEMCTTCHVQKKASLMRSSHMPLRQDSKMKCTSCHNPHGTPYPRMLLQPSINQTCYSCHTEKRGPFLWEHAPVRESCVNCHEPHGTVNDFLLKAKMPILCIQCHNGFAGGGMGNAHSARDRYALNQDCMNCHLAIHGSMHPQGNRFKR